MHLRKLIIILIFVTTFLAFSVSLRVGAKVSPRSYSPLEVTVVPHRFDNYWHQILWFRSGAADIALGANIGDFKDSNFGTRIHDAQTGPKEYSCFPDDVVYIEGAKRELAYAAYLRWEFNASLGDDGKEATIVYTHRPEYGMLTRYIEPAILESMSPVKLEAQVTHRLRSGFPIVETTIRLKNVYSEPVSAWWVYQDAASLYLPDGNQSNLLPVNTQGERKYNLTALESTTQWSGVVHVKQDIVSAIFCGAHCGSFSLPVPYAIEGFSTTECHKHKFDCPMGGNDRVIVQKQASPLEWIESVSPMLEEPPMLESNNFIGVVIDFGELQINQEIERKFYRIGMSGSNIIRELPARVFEQINSISKVF